MKRSQENSHSGRSGLGSNNEGALTLAGADAGIVGMGLMGTSIAACLLLAGHSVAAVELDPAKRRTARGSLFGLLREANKQGLSKSEPSTLLREFTISGEYSVLEGSHLVVECITENLQAKRRVIRQIEEVVSPQTIIGSNTSAIPISHLQQGALHPGRVLGIHWGEPAHLLRFMEIICGRKTRPDCAQRAMALARRWGKEPSLVRRDIRGFITNRLMYALMREGFYLVEAGYASIADIDRAVRNDLGFWTTFAGPFRFMDLTGIPAYATVMRDLFPDLSRATRVPRLIKRLVKSGACGVSNARGFYEYTPAEAKRWEELFLRFSYDIRSLAQKYPENIGHSPRRGRNGAAQGPSKRARASRSSRRRKME